MEYGVDDLEALWIQLSSEQWFAMIPKEFWIYAGPIALLLVGIVVETRYVSRISVFTNVVALNSFFAYFQGLPPLLIAYVNVGAIAGPLAFLAYSFKVPLSKGTYDLFAFFNSGISAILMISWLAHFYALPQ